MINFKKGTAYTLAQSDKVGNAKANEGVVAGMLVHVDASGDVIKGGTDAPNELLGFAVNNQTDGDSIESGKIGYVLLDGNSVIETDQADDTITLANYPVGTPLCAATGGDLGKVAVVSSTERVIGYVEGIRSIRGTALLGIKLAS